MRTETTLCLCLTWNSTTTPSTTSSMTALTTPNQGQRVSLCTHTSFMYFRHISVHTACGYCVNDAFHPACSRYNSTHITCYYIGVYVHVRMCPAPAGSRPPRISKVMLKIWCLLMMWQRWRWRVQMRHMRSSGEASEREQLHTQVSTQKVAGVTVSSTSDWFLHRWIPMEKR